MKNFQNYIIAALFLAWPVLQPAVAEAKEYYQASGHIFLSDVLPPPPVPQSEQDKADMDEVLDVQKNRTQENIAEAQLDNQLDLFRFAPAIGYRFTAKRLPLTVAFFNQVTHDEGGIVAVAKKHYLRPRPFVASDSVHPVVEKLDSASYPSGHSAFAYTTAILLAQMLPEKAPAIFTRAQRFAHNRVVAGVHYPTDVQAGMISAAVVVEALMQDPKFQADFAKAKKELRVVVMPGADIPTNP